MTYVSNQRIFISVKLAFIGLFLFVSQSIYAADELVGSDGGSFSVGNSGQGVWSMPIEVPSGINGVAPNLTLSLSTSGGNGSLGVGGGLSGLSSISRCGRTIHQDGYFQAPQYQQSDAYCLDGARLVLESGTYGASNSLYRTEIETFQRIKAHGAVAGKGPAYFVVTNRAGATMIYGQSDGTKEVDTDSGAVAVWKIDQLIDSNTNTLHYHYGDVSGDGEVQLTSVTYGGNTSQSVAESLSVELIYENRPDTSTTWSRGQQYSQTKRISAIKTKVGTTVVTNYKLSYVQGAITGASRLVTLQQCAGNGDCYRPSLFEYAAETQSDWVGSTLSLPAALQTSDGKPLGMLTDINNDGKSDWVSASTSAAGTETLTTYLGSESGWQASTNFELPDVLFDYSQNTDGYAKGLLLDVNGDGWPDYVQAIEVNGVTTLATWKNNGTRIEADPDPALALPTALISLQSDGSVRSLADLADLNADGLVDVVQSVVTSSATVQVAWLQSAVFDDETNSNTHSWSPHSDYAAPSIGIDYTQGTQGRVLAILQDVNADGLSDWVQSYKLDGSTVNATWLNTGQGFENNVSSQFSLPQSVALFNYDLTDKGVAEYTITDLNGDGLPDLSKAITINGVSSFDSWIHTGLTWQYDSDYNLPASMMLVAENGNVASVGGLIDLNSDGQPDFIRSYSDATTTVEGYWVFDKDTKQWSLTSDYDLPFINNRIQSDGTSLGVAEVADLNHDGFPELFNSLSGDVFETPQTQGYPGTLVGGTNPLGATTELHYGMSTDSAVYELAAQTPYPNVAYNAPVRVVATILVSTGIEDDPATSGKDESMISAHHRYGKAKTNLHGQGGQGYQYHTLIDGNSGVEVVSTFHQTYPYAGRVKASSKTLNDTLFSVSNSEMELIDITINNLTTQYPHPNNSIAETYDLSGTLLKITRSSSQIDGYGNATISTEEVFDADDNLVRRSTKTVDYKTPDLTRWLFGLPEKNTQTLFDVATNKTYSNEAVATFAADGKPLTETLEPSSSDWVKKTYTYDGFGNRVSSSVAAAGIADTRTNTTTLSGNGRFPETVNNTLGHTITTQFDHVLGKPEWVRDANGITKEFVYDGFGTVVKETKAHQNNGATRGRQIVLPKWCDENEGTNCGVNAGPDDGLSNAVYFIAAFDDEGEAPEIAYYDVNGKELRKQTYGFEGKIIVVETEYNENGQVSRGSQPYFKDEETATWTSYQYDVLGRQTRRNNAAGSNFYTHYNGLEVSTTNPGNEDTAAQKTRVINNIFGQPIESIDPDNNSTFYAYDGRGKLVKTMDAKGNIATITYDDKFGRKIAMDDPDLGAWSYEYNSLGSLIAQTDASGQRTTMEYDVLNRLVRRVDDLGEAKEEITSWEYSETKGNGQLIGALNKVISPNYERSVKYDDLSRVVEATSIIDDKPFVQRTGYLGTADKVDWIEYPSGLSVRNTYDEYGFPKTVEGITLDYQKYDLFQAASRELNRRQRALEAHKNESLSEADLFILEDHESNVRRLGKALGEFYETFEDDVTKKGHEAEALRYSGDEDKGIDGLVLRVQSKIKQHTDWYNIYQGQQNTHYNRIKDDLDRLNELVDLSAPHESNFEAAKLLHDNYAAKVTYYVGKMNAKVTQIRDNEQDRDGAVAAGQNNLDVVHYYFGVLFTPYWANVYKNDLNRYFVDTGNEANLGHVMNNFMNPGISEHVILHGFTHIGIHLTDYSNHIRNASDAQDRIEGYLAEYNGFKSSYDHWEPRRKTEENKMSAAVAQLNIYSGEATTLQAKVQPDLDRINDWLAPITQSHNNVILSFNDRARAYVGEISKQTGTYANREDLKSENFLKPFKNHIDYSACLRNQSPKSMGDCYKENLVHVLNDDGSVDTVKQAEERAKVEDDTSVDINQFWKNHRFFCSEYYGYSCATNYNLEIKQLAKTLHIQQCAKMNDRQKENNSASCDSSTWDIQVKAVAGADPHFSVYLNSSVQEFSSGLSSFYATLVTAHEAEIANLVSAATLNTYNEETNYSDIVELGGNLWQAAAPTPVAEGETDPRKFVMLRKGHIQELADSQMGSVAREANSELKGHQYQIAQLIGAGQSGNYNVLYRAVQEQADLVDRLYKEIDKAYALASDDDEFDDNAFNEAKKVYWQAQDINSKGQIKTAKYGNDTVTQWEYDQFGRINYHLTKNAANTTLLKNTYEYDAIGNLIQRHDYVEVVIEDFSYDNMNRLVQSDLTGSGAEYVTQLQGNVVNYDYDDLGNLTYKSDIGCNGVNDCYVYGDGAGPHAVTRITGSIGSFIYDDNGNQISGNGRTVVYNAFNKPTSIVKGGKQTEMWYGAERQMMKQRADTPSGKQTTLYVGGLFEEITTLGGGVVNRHHIAVAGNAIAVVDTKPGSLVAIKESYLHKNHQSSVLAITDMSGDVVERRYFDAFGDIKSYIGQASRQYASGIHYNSATDMGFTGHKTLASAGVIHMGGRIYDAMIGRFLSADPHIQSPLNSQSLNRYSYTLNNPLSWTDPSGYFLSSIIKSLKNLFKAIGKIIKSVLKVIKKVVKVIAERIKKIGAFVKKYARVIVAVVAAVAIVYFTAGAGAGAIGGLTLSPVAAGAAAGGASGLIMTGSLKGALEGAVFGAITAGFASYVATGVDTGKGIFAGLQRAVGSTGVNFAHRITQVVGHGAIGGLRSLRAGGKFLAGFVTGAIGKLVTFGVDKINAIARNPFAQGLVVATAGGLTSVLAGGSFELGFVTAGLAFATNALLENSFKNTLLPGKHSYGVRNKICDLGSKGCTTESVVAGINETGAVPSQDGRILFGVENDADIFGPWGRDDVITRPMFNESGEQNGIRNITQDNHLLDWGYVERTVHTIDNSIYIDTNGYGTGWLGGVNVGAAEFLWGGVDDSVRRFVSGE
jgi:RHS repeat-associated protein